MSFTEIFVGIASGGRAEEHGHFRQSDMPSGVEIHLGLLPSQVKRNKDFKLAILVARDRGTKMTMSSVAPSKTCAEFIAKEGGSRS